MNSFPKTSLLTWSTNEMRLQTVFAKLSTLLGLTQEAKLVSSKHFSDLSAHENLRSNLRKLGFTPDDKLY